MLALHMGSHNGSDVLHVCSCVPCTFTFSVYTILWITQKPKGGEFFHRCFLPCTIWFTVVILLRDSWQKEVC